MRDSAPPASPGIPAERPTIRPAGVDIGVVPVLNEWPRMRIQFNTRFRHELVNNLYINFAIADYFDSQPPSETEKNSLTFNTSVG